MTEYDYSDYQIHAQDHRRCFDELGSLITKFENEGSSSEVVQEIESFLINYIEKHICVFDLKLAEFLRGKTEK